MESWILSAVAVAVAYALIQIANELQMIRASLNSNLESLAKATWYARDELRDLKEVKWPHS